MRLNRNSTRGPTIDDLKKDLRAMRDSIVDLKSMVMSDTRNQWITHAKVILNDTLVHLPPGELKHQVEDLLSDDTV